MRVRWPYLGGGGGAGLLRLGGGATTWLLHLAGGATAGLLLMVIGSGEPGATSGGAYAAPQASTLPTNEAWFTDRTAAAGIDFVHFNGGSGEFYVSEVLGPGGAMLDVDNDGDLDIYLVQGQMLGRGNTPDPAALPPSARPLTDRLYRNDLDVRADGTRILRFTDITEESGLDVRSYGMGVAAGDIDNDGWVDLYRTRLGPNQLFRNNGDGTFTDVSAETGTADPGWSLSASFTDVDRDGWLDLYVGNYVDHRVDQPQPECFTLNGERDYCGPKAYAPVPDRLYRNRGDGTFADVTAEAGVAREYGSALGVAAADIDGDGWVDIYVANDGEPNLLWLNRRDGTLSERRAARGGGPQRPRPDRGQHGGRRRRLRRGRRRRPLHDPPDARDQHTLRQRRPRGSSKTGPRPSGLGAPSFAYTGFGTAWFDFDNDGWLDLLTVNGAVQASHQRFAGRARWTGSARGRGNRFLLRPTQSVVP